MAVSIAQPNWSALKARVSNRLARHLFAAPFQLPGTSPMVSFTFDDVAKSAAAVMGMNNIYYRFQHLAKNPKYATLPAGLRMNVLRNHGIDPVDFELWCTAVSAINGCGLCVDSHEQVLRDKGMSEETILAAVRLAAVIHGLATVFDTEAVVPSQTVPA